MDTIPPPECAQGSETSSISGKLSLLAKVSLKFWQELCSEYVETLSAETDVQEVCAGSNALGSCVTTLACGLQRDEDLAYAFESFEDAVRAGGQALAVQWLEARADPSRALNALRWLSKAGSLQFNLTNIVLPTPKSNRQRKKQQAIVVEPPMLPFLEQAIAQCWEQSNPKWSALLSSWLIAVGVMRHQHLLRSEPVRLSRSTLHLWCEKGKQSSKRGGFPWTVPAHFANGFGWAAAMLQAKRAVPAGKRESCGIIFSPWISLRTPGAGWGQPLGPLELNALGDWEDRSSLPDPAAMPVHYSGGKKATSMRVKHLVYQLGASLREHQSWDVITPSELEEAKAFVMPTVDRLVSQDMDTEWQGKLPAEQVQRAFKFSQATRESARAARASAAAERAAAKGLLPLAQEPAVPTEAPAEPAESEIIKGVPPAAAKGRKRSAEQVAPAAPAKKVKESAPVAVKADRQVELSAYTLLNRELVWTKAFDADLSLAGHEIHHHVRQSLLKSKRIHTSQRLTIIETESNSPINFNTKYINPSKGFTVSHRVRGKTPLSCMPILRKLKHESFVQQ
ncbi:ATP-dependent Clp protease ATP-binding subunit clpA-like [Durusdinium trenchii]|uniref:ATP-dependent Clp protease ATP-binding subunit clpA-like n=1 Tax=Durusdinium trenchii TaxID=1381693 RepID=A0ABP0KCV4_9DINO